MLIFVVVQWQNGSFSGCCSFNSWTLKVWRCLKTNFSFMYSWGPPVVSLQVWKLRELHCSFLSSLLPRVQECCKDSRIQVVMQSVRFSGSYKHLRVFLLSNQISDVLCSQFDSFETSLWAHPSAGHFEASIWNVADRFTDFCNGYLGKIFSNKSMHLKHFKTNSLWV